MTKAQKRSVIKLLSKDCQIEGKYLVGNKTCAIGCLALAAGVSGRTLKKHNSCVGIHNRRLKSVRKSIFDKFGLDDCSLREIQEANDGGHDSVSSRRKEVINYVKNHYVKNHYVKNL